MITPGYFAVAIEGQQWTTGQKKYAEQVAMYITAVSFKPGDGMIPAKILYNADKAKAHGFSKFSALAVMRELAGPRWRLIKVWIEDSTGAVVEITGYRKEQQPCT